MNNALRKISVLLLWVAVALSFLLAVSSVQARSVAEICDDLRELSVTAHTHVIDVRVKARQVRERCANDQTITCLSDVTRANASVRRAGAESIDIDLLIAGKCE